MSDPDARRVAAHSIPVIDIAPLVSGEDCPDTAAGLRRASQDPGFIYVRNHGIAHAVIHNARSSAHEFFLMPEAVKSEVSVSAHHRGWLSAGGARMADDVPADLKESFIWGYPDDVQPNQQDHSLRGPNQWPDRHLPDFHHHAKLWFDAASQVARCLMRSFATSLGLDPAVFLTDSDKPLSRASYVYYPHQPASKSEQGFGVGPHTDFGVLTVLHQDEVGGLHIENADGEWVDAPPIEDTLIVNVGDLLARWTNGAFRSAPHRVVNPSDRDRLSLVLAYDPNPETRIDAGEVFPGATDCAEPITCGDYLDWRFSKAFSYRR